MRLGVDCAVVGTAFMITGTLATPKSAIVNRRPDAMIPKTKPPIRMYWIIFRFELSFSLVTL